MAFRNVSMTGLIFCLALLPSCTRAPLSRIDFQGWSDCYRISNDKAQVVIVPSVGRMMSYRLTNGRNVLDINPARAGVIPSRPQKEGYIYFGGLYTWIAPQCRWIPYNGKDLVTGADPVLDNGPYRVTAMKEDELTMTSPVSRGYGLQMTKTFKLVKGSSKLEFTVTLRNTASVPIRWAVWNLSGVQPDGIVFFDVPGGKSDLQFPVNSKKDSRKFARSLRVYDNRTAAVDFRKYRKDGGKIFVRRGSDYLAYRRPGSWFVRRFPTNSGDIYTDWQSQVEIWADAQIGHIFELETASPDFVIPPGKTVAWTEWLYIVEDNEPLSAPTVEAAKIKNVLKQTPGFTPRKHKKY